jgi:hypothetical protein
MERPDPELVSRAEAARQSEQFKSTLLMPSPMNSKTPHVDQSGSFNDP